MYSLMLMYDVEFLLKTIQMTGGVYRHVTLALIHKNTTSPTYYTQHTFIQG